jgi:hypothetical protein
MHDVMTKGEAKIDIGFEAGEHRLVAFAGRVVTPALGAENADQAADQFQRFGFAIAEGGERGGDRIGLDHGLAEQPVKK